MTERLVPYKSYAYRNAEGNAMIIVMVVVGAAMRFYFERSPIESIIAILLSTFAFGPISNVWARARGTEFIEQSEELLRYYRELAAQPAWHGK